MLEPKYDEDTVNLGYLKKVISDTEKNIDDVYKNVSRYYASRPQPPYYKGDTWIDGDIVYTCINTRTIGFYQDSDWVTESGAKTEAERKNKTYISQPSNYNPGDMWILQSDEDHRAGKKGEILISTAGRKEYDSDDWINMLGYGTIKSINEVAGNLNNAIKRIGNVEEAIQDGLIITFYQDTVPEGIHLGDLWYVTGEVEGYTKGKIYRYDGINWIILNDPTIQEAFDEANEARIVADGKIQSFYSSTEPTENMGVGDLWIDTANNNQLYRYNGTNWVAVYDTRINELVKSVDTVTERVATIETDLGQIDLKIQENTTSITIIKGNVEDIQDNIVSLQAQIDGAIQFWNGSEIPTAENYPASEWITEADKNNHRADIYTVIDDVHGELKQGKSYRFDKVGDTWQWIELTDNELSAVQALATSKAKVFIATPTVPYSVGDLWLNNGKLYRCKTAKDSNGTYSLADWEIAVNYTDDTVAELAKTLANNAQNTADSAVEGVNNITNTKGEAEGKQIHLTDSAEEPLVDIRLHGESTQKTRSGKNLYNKRNVSGTLYKEVPINELPAGTYTLSAVATSSDTDRTQCLVLDATNNKNLGYLNRNVRSSFTFTLEKPTKKLNFYASTDYNLSNEDTFKFADIQIEQGTTATEYEPYGVMPSPDYPSEIENIEGKNKFNYKKLTPTFNINGDEKEFTITAPNVGTTVYEYSGFKTSKQYTLSGFYSSTSLDGVFRIKYSDNTYTAIKAIYDGSAVSKTKFSVTSTVNKTIVSIQFILYGNTYDLTFYDFQIEEGTVATPYVPYNSLEFKVEGKNLLNLLKCSFSGCTLNSDNKSLTCNLNNQYFASIYPSGLNNWLLENKGKTITFSTGTTLEGKNTGIVIYGTRSDGSTYQEANKIGTGKCSITIADDFTAITSIELRFNRQGTTFTDTTTVINYAMLELGSTATDYEPYKSQVATFPLGEGEKLYQGSYLADDGIHHKRKQVVFDGSDDERWLLYSAYNSNGGIGYCYQIENASFALGNNTSICSHFKNVSTAYMPSTGYVGAYCDHLTVYRKYFISDKSTLAEWKAWLSNNPITVEYELAEPEIVPYTAEQQEAWNNIRALMTYKNVTNITSTAYAKVTYMRDNGLDVYETKQNAQKKYTETSEKLAEQKMTVDGVITQVSDTNKRLTNDYLTAEQVNAELDTTKENIEIIKQNQVTMSQTSKNLQIAIDTINNEGVSKVKTSMGYTFDDEGFKLNRSNAETGTIIDEAAVQVIDKTGASEQNLLYAGYVKEGNTEYQAYIGQTIVAGANMIVRNYLVVPNSRFEEYTNPVLGGKGTGVFGI